MPMIQDYQDGRLFAGKPIAAHLRPDYWPQREKQTFRPSVKIRHCGEVIRTVFLDGEETSLERLIG